MPAALPLLKVDWELVADQEFRNLLAALNFEATYDPREHELTIGVTLIPELTDPDGSRAPFVRAPGRIRTCDTRFRKPVLYPLSYEGHLCDLGRKA
ncbi:MAG: hypothetical protein QOG21_1986 [Actinomycetota bacterium]|nr:hypothetical protein [Actinomycetota bacterium]